MTTAGPARPAVRQRDVRRERVKKTATTRPARSPCTEAQRPRVRHLLVRASWQETQAGLFELIGDDPLTPRSAKHRNPRWQFRDVFGVDTQALSNHPTASKIGWCITGKPRAPGCGERLSAASAGGRTACRFRLAGPVAATAQPAVRFWRCRCSARCSKTAFPTRYVTRCPRMEAANRPA